MHDVEASTETILLDILNDIRMTNPIDRSAILLPLSPPDYVPEILVCGGADVKPAVQPVDLSPRFSATSQRPNNKLTQEGIPKAKESCSRAA